MNAAWPDISSLIPRLMSGIGLWIPATRCPYRLQEIRAIAIHEVQEDDVAGGSFDEGSDGRDGPTQDVGSDRSALPAFELVGFSGPPAEPDVRLSPHPALHRFMPLVRVILPSWRSPMVWGCEHAGSGIE